MCVTFFYQSILGFYIGGQLKTEVVGVDLLLKQVISEKCDVSIFKVCWPSTPRLSEFATPFSLSLFLPNQDDAVRAGFGGMSSKSETSAQSINLLNMHVIACPMQIRALIDSS